MSRYLILMALLLCLPVRGEAWQVVGGGGEPTMILNDTLYSELDTAIGDYTVTPGPGGDWTSVGLTPVSVYTNGARATLTSDSGIAINSTGPFESGTVEIEGTNTNTATSRKMGACKLVNSDPDGYCAFAQGDGTFYLATLTNGVFSAPISSTVSIPGYSTGEEFIIELKVEGSSLTATAHMTSTPENTATATATDTTYSGSGYPGVLITNTAPKIAKITAYAY